MTQFFSKYTPFYYCTICYLSISLFFLTQMAVAQPWTVTNTNDGGPGTLRQAIIDANASSGGGLIQFNIPGGGSHTIYPATELPLITQSNVIIDATTQPSNSPMAGLIIIDGSSVSGSSVGIGISGANYFEIYGLVITNFAVNPGLYINNSNYFTIGAVDQGNVINASLIGLGVYNSNYGIVQSNKIGTDILGTSGNGNLNHGFRTYNCTELLIGGYNIGEGNVISGNQTQGIGIGDVGYSDTGYSIIGNAIGTDETGTIAIPNLGHGIDKQFDVTSIVTNIFIYNNIVANNGGHGISLVDEASQSWRISQNNIYCNAYNGIRLPTNANNNISPPTITSVDLTQVSGTAQAQDTVEVFIQTQSCDDCGGSYPQAETYLGRAYADGSGDWTLNSVDFQATLTLGQSLTATATNDHTSQFAPCFLLADPCSAPYVISPTTIEVTHTGDTGAGSLREAINCVNADPTLDNIHFNIPGGGTQIIQPASALPTIYDDNVTIDGTTQTGNSPMVGLIVLDGMNVAGPGLLLGDDSGTFNGHTVKGMVIRNFPDDGIMVQNGRSAVIGGVDAGNVIYNNSVGITFLGTTNSTIQGNSIGVEEDGATTNGNGVGIHTNQTTTGSFTGPSSDNLIGGDRNLGEGNIIGGNTSYGIHMFNAPNNTIKGNLIGISSTNSNIGNGSSGIRIENALTNNTIIGSSLTGEKNIISYNMNNGIIITNSVTSTYIYNNYIGTNINGTIAAPNQDNGILIHNCSDVTIGSGNTNEGNLISGNAGYGIYAFNGSSSIIIQGNKIGTDINGTSAIKNNYEGVRFDNVTNGLIGGFSTAEGNLISSNGINNSNLNSNGIAILNGSINCQIYNNIIGLDANATNPLPNKANGIYISGSSNTQIGTTGQGNIISANELYGIEIENSSTLSIGSNNIGLDGTQSTANGNASGGIFLSQSGNIYVGQPNDGNVIAGNNPTGIIVSNNTAPLYIQSNYIGTDNTQMNAMPNDIIGIDLSNANDVSIGYNNDPLYANIIAHHGDYGVYVRTGSSNVHIAQNSFYCNNKGIHLGNTANNSQPTPNITLADLTTINGDGVNPSDSIHIYTHDETGCLLTGIECQGKTYLGYAIADGMGSWTFDPSSFVSGGEQITALSVDGSGNLHTSEFAACRTILACPTVANPANGTQSGCDSYTPDLSFSVTNLAIGGDLSNLDMNDLNSDGVDWFFDSMQAQPYIDGETITVVDDCGDGIYPSFYTLYAFLRCDGNGNNTFDPIVDPSNDSYEPAGSITIEIYPSLDPNNVSDIGNECSYDVFFNCLTDDIEVHWASTPTGTDYNVSNPVPTPGMNGDSWNYGMIITGSPCGYNYTGSVTLSNCPMPCPEFITDPTIAEDGMTVCAYDILTITGDDLSNISNNDGSESVTWVYDNMPITDPYAITNTYEGILPSPSSCAPETFYFMARLDGANDPGCLDQSPLYTITIYPDVDPGWLEIDATNCNVITSDFCSPGSLTYYFPATYGGTDFGNNTPVGSGPGGFILEGDVIDYMVFPSGAAVDLDGTPSDGLPNTCFTTGQVTISGCTLACPSTTVDASGTQTGCTSITPDISLSTVGLIIGDNVNLDTNDDDNDGVDWFWDMGQTNPFSVDASVNIGDDCDPVNYPLTRTLYAFLRCDGGDNGIFDPVDESSTDSYIPAGSVSVLLYPEISALNVTDLDNTCNFSVQHCSGMATVEWASTPTGTDYSPSNIPSGTFVDGDSWNYSLNFTGSTCTPYTGTAYISGCTIDCPSSSGASGIQNGCASFLPDLSLGTVNLAITDNGTLDQNDILGDGVDWFFISSGFNPADQYDETSSFTALDDCVTTSYPATTRLYAALRCDGNANGSFNPVGESATDSYIPAGYIDIQVYPEIESLNVTDLGNTCLPSIDHCMDGSGLVEVQYPSTPTGIDYSTTNMPTGSGPGGVFLDGDTWNYQILVLNSPCTNIYAGTTTASNCGFTCPTISSSASGSQLYCGDQAPDLTLSTVNLNIISSTNLDINDANGDGVDWFTDSGLTSPYTDGDLMIATGKCDPTNYTLYAALRCDGGANNNFDPVGESATDSYIPAGSITVKIYPPVDPVIILDEGSVCLFSVSSDCLPTETPLTIWYPSTFNGSDYDPSNPIPTTTYDNGDTYNYAAFPAGAESDFVDVLTDCAYLGVVTLSNCGVTCPSASTLISGTRYGCDLMDGNGIIPDGLTAVDGGLIWADQTNLNLNDTDGNGDGIDWFTDPIFTNPYNPDPADPDAFYFASGDCAAGVYTFYAAMRCDGNNNGIFDPDNEVTDSYIPAGSLTLEIYPNITASQVQDEGINCILNVVPDCTTGTLEIYYASTPTGTDYAPTNVPSGTGTGGAFIENDSWNYIAFVPGAQNAFTDGTPSDFPNACAYEGTVTATNCTNVCPSFTSIPITAIAHVCEGTAPDLSPAATGLSFSSTTNLDTNDPDGDGVDWFDDFLPAGNPYQQGDLLANNFDCQLTSHIFFAYVRCDGNGNGVFDPVMESLYDSYEYAGEISVFVYPQITATQVVEDGLNCTLNVTESCIDGNLEIWYASTANGTDYGPSNSPQGTGTGNTVIDGDTWNYIAFIAGTESTLDPITDAACFHESTVTATNCSANCPQIITQASGIQYFCEEGSPDLNLNVVNLEITTDNLNTNETDSFADGIEWFLDDGTGNPDFANPYTGTLFAPLDKCTAGFHILHALARCDGNGNGTFDIVNESTTDGYIAAGSITVAVYPLFTDISPSGACNYEVNINCPNPDNVEVYYFDGISYSTTVPTTGSGPNGSIANNDAIDILVAIAGVPDQDDDGIPDCYSPLTTVATCACPVINDPYPSMSAGYCNGDLIDITDLETQIYNNFSDPDNQLFDFQWSETADLSSPAIDLNTYTVSNPDLCTSLRISSIYAIGFCVSDPATPLVLGRLDVEVYADLPQLTPVDNCSLEMTSSCGIEIIEYLDGAGAWTTSVPNGSGPGGAVVTGDQVTWRSYYSEGPGCMIGDTYTATCNECPTVNVASDYLGVLCEGDPMPFSDAENLITINDPQNQSGGIQWFEDAARTIAINTDTYTPTLSTVCDITSINLYAGVLCLSTETFLPAVSMQVEIYPNSFTVSPLGGCNLTLQSDCEVSGNLIIEYDDGNGWVTTPNPSPFNGEAWSWRAYIDGTLSNGLTNCIQEGTTTATCTGCPNILTTTNEGVTLCEDDAPNFTNAESLITYDDPNGQFTGIAWYEDIALTIPIDPDNYTVAPSGIGICEAETIVLYAAVLCASDTQPISAGQLTITLYPDLGSIAVVGDDCNINMNSDCTVGDLIFELNIDGTWVSNPDPANLVDGTAYVWRAYIDGAPDFDLDGVLDCSVQSNTVTYNCTTCPVIIKLGDEMITCGATLPDLTPFENDLLIDDTNQLLSVAWYENIELTIPIDPNNYELAMDICGTTETVLYPAVICSLDPSPIPIAAGILTITSYSDALPISITDDCLYTFESSCPSANIVLEFNYDGTWTTVPNPNPESVTSWDWRAYLLGAPDLDADGVPDCLTTDTQTNVNCLVECPSIDIQGDYEACTSEGILNLDDFKLNSEAGSWDFLYQANGPNPPILNSPNLDISNADPDLYELIFVPDNPVDGCPLFSPPLLLTIITSGDAGTGSTATYCTNATDTIQLFSLLENATLGGTWSLSSGLPINGTFDPNNATFIVTNQAAGTYTFTYGFTPNACINTTSTSVSVVIENADESSFIYPVTACINNTNPNPILSPITIGGIWTVDGGAFIDNEGVLDLTSVNVGQQYTITYTTDGACPSSDSQPITIIDTPTGNINTSASGICVGETVVISFLGNAAADATYNWNFNGGTPATVTGEGPHNISWTSAGTKTISLMINDSGCISELLTSTIEVVDEVAAPVVNCQPSLDAITFNWNAISGISSYEISINEETPITISDTTYTVEGLQAGDEVQFDIFAIHDNVCSQINTSSLTCQAQDCPNLEVNITPELPICLFPGGIAVPFNLNVTVTGGTDGTGLWSGSGIIDETIGIFDINNAGLGNHTITYTYTENGCSSIGSTIISIYENPTADFDLMTEFCNDGSQDLIVTYTGNASINAEYDWNLGGMTILASTNQSLILEAGIEGTYTISLIVRENECISELVSKNIQIDQPPTIPSITCVSSTENTIEISWNNEGDADGYELAIDRSPLTTIANTENTYTLTNLAPGQSYTIELIALNDGICGNSLAGIQTCTTQIGCNPNFQPTINAFDNTICQNAAPINFSQQVNPTGGIIYLINVGQGDTIVINNLNPQDYPIGEYILFYDYNDGTCDYRSNNYPFQIVENPSLVTFANPNNQNWCIGEPITISLLNPDPSLTYYWDAPTGNLSDNINNGEPITVSWDLPANYTVLVYAIDNNGCSSNEATALNVQVTDQLNLGTPTIICNNITPNEVSFSWNDITDAVSYEVTTIINGSSTGSETINTTIYTIPNLNDGDEVQIQIRTIGMLSCMFSEQLSTTCIAKSEPLPPIVLIDTTSTPNPDNDHYTFVMEIDGGDGNYVVDGIDGTVNGGIFTTTNLLCGTAYTITISDGSGTAPISINISDTDYPCPITTCPPLSLSIDAPITSFCETDAAITLTGDPLGGIFNGNGILGNTFDPVNAGVGIHTIYYQYTDDNACAYQDSIQLSVIAKANEPTNFSCETSVTSITFNWDAEESNFEISYDINDTGQSIPEIINTNTFTLDNLNEADQVSFYVKVLSECDSDLVGTTCTTAACEGLALQITNLPANICADEDAFELIPNITGGIFSGEGITGNTFDPALVSSNSSIITYHYTGDGCQDSISQSINLYEVPVLNWSSDQNAICEGEAINIAISLQAGELPWSFTFQDQSGNQVSENVWINRDTSITLSPTSTTTYELTNVSSAVCGTRGFGTQAITIEVEPLPAPPTVATNIVEMCADDNIPNLTAIPSGDHDIYWYDSEEALLFIGAGETWQPNAPGIYWAAAVSRNLQCTSIERVAVELKEIEGIELAFSQTYATLCNDESNSSELDLNNWIINGTGGEWRDITPYPNPQAQIPPNTFENGIFKAMQIPPNDYQFKYILSNEGVCGGRKEQIITIRVTNCSEENCYQAFKFGYSEDDLCGTDCRDPQPPLYHLKASPDYAKARPPANAKFVYSLDGGPATALSNWKDIPPGLHTVIITDTVSGCQTRLSEDFRPILEAEIVQDLDPFTGQKLARLDYKGLFTDEICMIRWSTFEFSETIPWPKDPFPDRLTAKIIDSQGCVAEAQVLLENTKTTFNVDNDSIPIQVNYFEAPQIMELYFDNDVDGPIQMYIYDVLGRMDYYGAFREPSGKAYRVELGEALRGQGMYIIVFTNPYGEIWVKKMLRTGTF